MNNNKKQIEHGKKNIGNGYVNRKNMNFGLMFGIAFLVLVFFSMFSMMYNYNFGSYGGYGMFGMMSYFPGMMVFGILFMMLITVALVLLIAWLWKQLKR